MAKQTFTTGQVLLASQLTSLQQTAMLGGSASNKTSSYTLVAADAGTAISMTSTSATTITVNTGLFAAGDTVQITNLSTGVLTITAGTATVNTSASLALAQYESGTLNFTSTSAAIFIKGAGAASGGMTLINTGGTTLTGASVLISSIPATYKNLQLVVRNFLPSLDNAEIRLRFNDDSTGNRHASDTSNLDGQTFNATMIRLGPGPSNSTSQSLTITDIYDYANTTTWKMANSNTVITYHVDTSKWSFANVYGLYNQTTAISSLRLLPNAGNFTSGTAFLYGVS